MLFRVQKGPPSSVSESMSLRAVQNEAKFPRAYGISELVCLPL